MGMSYFDIGGDVETVRAELQQYLQRFELRLWPGEQRFRADGKGDLYDRAVAAKPAREWASELGYGYRGPTPLWDDAKIEAELRTFLGDCLVWPTRREFNARNRGDLHSAVSRSGGPARWARVMNVIPPDADASYFTEDVIRALLPRAVELNGGEFPTGAQLRNLRLGRLQTAMAMHGGAKRWAAELGYGDEPFTDEMIEAKLRNLVEAYGGWPTERQFADAGENALLREARRRGIKNWAEKLGVTPPRRGRRREWPDERIISELSTFVAGREVWPTAKEFKVAGYTELFEAASRHRGMRHWSEHFGIQMRAQTPGARGPKTTAGTWTEERIISEAAKLVKLTGVPEPSFTQAAQHGFSKLWEAMRKHGGAGLWWEQADQAAALLPADADLSPAGMRSEYRSVHWTHERILVELAELIRLNDGVEPTRKQAMAMSSDAGNLWQAMYQKRGPAYYFTELAAKSDEPAHRHEVAELLLVA